MAPKKIVDNLSLDRVELMVTEMRMQREEAFSRRFGIVASRAEGEKA